MINSFILKPAHSPKNTRLKKFTNIYLVILYDLRESTHTHTSITVM